MKTNFSNRVQGVIGVAALVMVASMIPQQASAAESDKYDGTKYGVTAMALASTAVMAAVDIGFEQGSMSQVPSGGDSAIKLMQGRRDGYALANAKLNPERIRQIEEYILTSKPDIVTLNGDGKQFSTKINYDKLDRPINMREVRATLKRAEASKTLFSGVKFSGRDGSASYHVYQAPAVPENPRRIQKARKVRNAAGWLTAVPLTAWLIDKRTQAAGIPQSRKGYVADRFEKALDTVVGKFSSKNAGKAGAEAAN